MQTSIDLELSTQPTDASATTIELIDAIENVISSLDTDKTAFVSQGQSDHLWKFQYGSVEVFVQLTGTTVEDVLTVWAAVLPLPCKDEAKLTRELLTLNWLSTFEARYAIEQNQVVVTATRTVEEISPSEIARAITLVASIADEQDDRLKAEYGL